MDRIMEKIVPFLAETSYARIPEEAISATKTFFLDTLGVGLAGAEEPGCRDAVDLVKQWSSKESGSTIIYFGGKVSPPDAAFANSVLMHALDFDEVHDHASLHAHVAPVPAVLAMAEAKGTVSGKELLTAIVLGVDLTCRLGMAIPSPLSWMRTATCGSFGAAAGAAKVLGGGRREIENAIGIVYAQTSGNAQCIIDGGLTKRMQPGFAARSAVLSAGLGARGVTGATNIFEGEYGFFNLYERGNVEPEKVIENLGNHFGVMDLSIKLYPCCRLTHSSIDAALEIGIAHGIDSKKISNIAVSVSKMAFDICGAPFEVRANPTVDAQFSIAYTVAVALSKGGVFIDDFVPDTIRKEYSILELAKRVTVLIDSNAPPRDLSSTITVTMDNGKSFFSRVDSLKGSPSRPLTFDECADKFRKCIEYSKSSALIERSEAIVEFIYNLEKNEDALSLLEKLRG